MSIDAIFTYGTLQPGEVSAYVLKDVPGDWRAGHVRGDLIPAGWGAKFGFPGLKLNAAGAHVPGMLFRTPEIDRVLTILDDLEGAEYRRSVAEVTLEDGTIVSAFVYELAEAGDGAA